MQLGEGSAVSACQLVRSEFPQTKIIFMGSAHDPELMGRVLGEGASGYLLQDIAPTQLIHALEMVTAGHTIIAHEVAVYLKDWLKQHPLTTQHEGKLSGLSVQQLRILSLIADGKTNREIGASLGLSEKTVRNYLAKAYEKLKISRRTEATALFVKHTS